MYTSALRAASKARYRSAHTSLTHSWSQVWDRDYLKPDDLLGCLELPVTAVMTWTRVCAKEAGVACLGAHAYACMVRPGPEGSTVRTVSSRAITRWECVLLAPAGLKKLTTSCPPRSLCPAAHKRQGGVRGVRDGWWRLRPKGQKSWEGPGAGRIELRVQYRPYTT